MTEWELAPTSFDFKENGLFIMKGYLGDGDGTYSLSGNKILTFVQNVPFINFEVTDKEEYKASLTATIQGTGQKIWLVCNKYELNEGGTNPPVISEDLYFTDEATVTQMIEVLYSSLSAFIIKKTELETAVLAGDFRELNPSSHVIGEIWSGAYKVLNLANTIYNGLESQDSFPWYKAHAQFIRGFVGLHLATLWGNVPFFVENVSAGNIPDAMTQGEILRQAYNDLTDNFDASFESKVAAWKEYAIGDKARRMIAAEVALALGNADAAKNQLKNISASVDVIWALRTSSGESFPVYSSKTLELLLKEADGDTSDLPQLWSSAGLQYGYWQMLKRIGKAQEVSGCADYQLLWPIPERDVEYAGLEQNEGY